MDTNHNSTADLIKELQTLQEPLHAQIHLDKNESYSAPSQNGENLDSRQTLEKHRAQRDEGFTVLVKRFVENYGDKYFQNKEFKREFFDRVLLLFTATLLSPFVVLLLAACNALDGGEVIAAFLSVVSTIIPSIIIIPKIIAK